MKKEKEETEGGIMFTPAKLYDGNGVEIGCTNYTPECVAYAMANSTRVMSAKTFSPLFGSEEIRRSDISEQTLQKVRNKHNLGDYLIFWVGKPIIVNK